MTFFSGKRLRIIVLAASAGLLAIMVAAPATADEPEPIAYIGHGALFDSGGREIVPTVEFVERAQAWYRKRLLTDLSPAKRAEFSAFEARLTNGLRPEGQARLVLQHRALDWLLANSPRLKQDARTLGKLNLIKYRLTWTLPTGKERVRTWGGEKFVLPREIERKLALPEFNAGGGNVVFLATANSGQAYLDECAAAGVPMPPPIGQMDPAGLAGWKIQGSIPTGAQFIVQTPAEFRTFESPAGLCVALPRFSNAAKTTVALDGVICLSKTTSKVCIWDNQMNGNGFSFPAGAKVPIGVPDLAVNPNGLYQAGGFELEGGTGGVCTDCHAGENPYIIHPEVSLGAGVAMGDLNSPPLNLSTFAPNRYVPLVPASWPQNGSSQAGPSVPPVCVGCHQKGSVAGRFPHLSNQLPGYCGTILQKAVAMTMPPGAGGSQAANPAVVAFKAWCNAAATSSTEDLGDPHLKTTNGIHYDFQAAGEFTSLRNSDTGFELQTRQTPVTTTFTPGANPYTGLASCVSINTAVAVRVGRHRITYQASQRRPGSAANMQLRIDGSAVSLPASGVSLSGGNRVLRADQNGAIEVRLADGTRLIVTPTFWASQGYWYLNVEVLDTPAREGTMGHIFAGQWLPQAPDGSLFGAKPGPLADRHILLNQKFADAWRVTNANSLFNYAPGTSTASFTDRNWPPKPGGACRATIGPWGTPPPSQRPIEPIKRGVAERLCRPVLKDKPTFEDCVFDVTAMGDPAVADAYRRTLELRMAAGN
jgi:hypothetical protein